MTNREKLIQVLRDNIEYELRHYPDDNYVEVAFNYEAIADALIAAGIGDVTEYKETIRDLNTDVVERALFNMTKEYILAKHKIATTKDGQFLVGERMIALFAGDAIKQAEKELAEEKNGGA